MKPKIYYDLEKTFFNYNSKNFIFYFSSSFHDFGIIFKEFCKREPIYGFGDLQVKRLLSELEN